MMRKVAEHRRWFMTLALKQGSGGKGGRKMENAEKLKAEKPEPEEKRARKGSRHTAKEKCRAVLSVWTERRKAGEVCRELGVTWNLLNQWQERAMEGMLLALQPRIVVRREVALNPRLAVLLERKSKEGTMKKLEQRLARLQENPAK